MLSKLPISTWQETKYKALSSVKKGHHSSSKCKVSIASQASVSGLSLNIWQQWLLPCSYCEILSVHFCSAKSSMKFHYKRSCCHITYHLLRREMHPNILINFQQQSLYRHCCKCLCVAVAWAWACSNGTHSEISCRSFVFNLCSSVYVSAVHAWYFIAARAKRNACNAYLTYSLALPNNRFAMSALEAWHHFASR